ncbi:hypothetical protein [Mycobacterium asiaticum]|uniref:Uncharacterized protein n=1 Tax=Mycobacterium asiaticum TaxID=1790 RepID=A0A1A3MYH2_MYCAS|nr:hypothetical protein [Mycobacterium asiaticum]OBK14576.1 hypothetical protein A5636_07640 [Mycobacterium asiaticum]
MRALAASFACLAIASCATTATVTPPAAQTTPSTVKPPPNAVAPPPQHISALAKDWKTYGQTVYFGCPGEFSASKSALEDIRPKILDPKSADLIMPAVPAVAPGDTVTGAMCALSNDISDMKVVYVLSTVKPGTVAKNTAYVFDLKSSQPLATRELQPPAPDLKLAPAKDWRLAPTRTGVAWLNAFTDARPVASPPRTVILANTDLSTLWDDPQQGRVWQDILSFPRSTVPGSTAGAELRLPTGEPIHQDNDIATVDGELSDGPDKLVQITRWDSQHPPVMSTQFFDLASRSMIKLGDTERISGGGLVATLSDGKLFVDGRGSDTSQFGYGVWNLRTQHWDLLTSRDEAKKQPISKLAFFGDHLYVTNTAGTFSVLALPATEPVATNWSGRPFGRITGWTLVCQGETAPSQHGDCKEIVLVQDADGRYPGPWF